MSTDDRIRIVDWLVFYILDWSMFSILFFINLSQFVLCIRKQVKKTGRADAAKQAQFKVCNPVCFCCVGSSAEQSILHI